MSMFRVSCPHCSFSRDLPADKLPDQPMQATCPKCQQSFMFDKASAQQVAPPVRPTSPPPPLPQAGGVMPPPLPPTTPKNSAAGGAGSNRGYVSRELLSIGELFSATWELYKQRWLLLLGIFIATGIACVVPPMLVGLGMSGMAKGSFAGLVTLLMAFGVALIGSFLIACWGMAAAVSAAVDEKLGFNDSFQHAKGCWLSLAWVSGLYSFIVGGASLLFLIPGLLTGIWFFACVYLVVAEEDRGMDALLKSKALVDGRFWAVTGRLLLVWLLGTLLGMIPFIGPILSLLLAPFTMLYSVLLYRNLSETAGMVTWSSTDGTKAGWLVLGLAGYVLVPLMLFFMLGATFFTNVLPLLQMGITQKHGQPVLPFKSPGGSGSFQMQPAPGQMPQMDHGAPKEGAFQETDLSIFIYAVNCPGTIRVNGQEFKIIKSTPDMQYNINTFGTHFRPGSNTIEFDLAPVSGGGRGLPPRVHMKVSRNNAVLGEWKMSDQEGWTRSVTLDITETKAL